MTAVVFDYATWVARYPEFASVSPLLVADYFTEAGMYVNNTDCSIVPADAVTFQPRKMLLNMVVAHIAALNAPVNGAPASPLVGRISQATEGTVSVQAEMLMPPGSSQWFMQTKYGAAFWSATRRYRTMQYVPGAPQVNPYTNMGGLPGWGRPWAR